MHRGYGRRDRPRTCALTTKSTSGPTPAHKDDDGRQATGQSVLTRLQGALQQAAYSDSWIYKIVKIIRNITAN